MEIIASRKVTKEITKNKRVTSSTQRCPDQSFQAGCSFPFSNEVMHEIDQRCPSEGDCRSGDRIKLQNRIKNNFCAAGPVVDLSFASFDLLQKRVDELVAKGEIGYGKGQKPPKTDDRGKLRDLPIIAVTNKQVNAGEGTLVSLEGFVLDAKHESSFPLGLSGESVNCNNPALNWNDIHISLAQSANDSECASVSAKISPHFRPVLWDRFDSNGATVPFVKDPLPVKGLQVKITGQLFFDGSQLPKPCRAPKRRTSWEIHPVYRIEVFDRSKNQFVDLEEWARDK